MSLGDFNSPLNFTWLCWQQSCLDLLRVQLYSCRVQLKSERGSLMRNSALDSMLAFFEADIGI